MNKRSAENTKYKILNAARKIFTENGYSDASMRLIAKSAEISVGCLYLHFKNKEDLYLTLMIQWMDHLNLQTEKALSRAKDPVEAIRIFISMAIEFARSHREMILMQGKEMGVSVGIEQRQAFFQRRRQLLKEIIEEGIDGGTFAPCDSTAASKVIFNAIRGFVFSIVIDEDALFSADECSNLMLNGLVRRSDG